MSDPRCWKPVDLVPAGDFRCIDRHDGLHCDEEVVVPADDVGNAVAEAVPDGSNHNNRRSSNYNKAPVAVDNWAE